jgi:alkanesulfonate monooxygenase SsuD/methylene tetrahydromethanopterin reductase-like flavin-dependent oxidoreductase (luciferase family)
VLNNDCHHPVHLARELASIDHLSGGRLEVGIGAGHAFTEYAAVGQTFDPPAARKRAGPKQSRSCAGCWTATR